MNSKTGYDSFIQLFVKRKMYEVGEQLQIDKNILDKINIITKMTTQGEQIRMVSDCPLAQQAIKQMKVYSKLEKL